MSVIILSKLNMRHISQMFVACKLRMNLCLQGSWILTHGLKVLHVFWLVRHNKSEQGRETLQITSCMLQIW